MNVEDSQLKSIRDNVPRDFILSLCSEGQRFDEVIMNLPQSATDFLDVFIGLLKRKDSQGNRWENFGAVIYSVFNRCKPIYDMDFLNLFSKLIFLSAPRIIEGRDLTNSSVVTHRLMS